jgi:hypothetical protein
MYQPAKSAVAEHSTESGHRIKFHETEGLAETSGYMERLVKEAIEINLNPENINREERFKLSKAWNPRTSLLRHSNTHTSRKSREERAKNKTK